jgi:6-pyruvoyltetrahydropterin/6-carboxytetrahydropterin synthase
MMYRVVKRYDHNLGLTVCFRQHRAKSHCRHLHGYALAIELTFASELLDENNWVIDFGCLRPVKVYLADNFDHITIVAVDDPELQTFKMLQDRNLCKMRIVASTGCESFAKEIYDWVNKWLPMPHKERGVILESVKVSEHGGNSAVYNGSINIVIQSTTGSGSGG